jgi:ankyrin repeat protein
MNKDGLTALIEAAMSGHASVVRLLLSANADVNHVSNVSHSSLGGKSSNAIN